MEKILYTDGDIVLYRKEVGEEVSESGILLTAERELGAKVYPVHRLDTATGGILCLAKNRESAARLSEAFASHAVKKEYLCVCAGRPSPDAGEMNDILYYLASAQKSFVTDRRRRGAKEARLAYRVLQTVDDGNGNPVSLVSVLLFTGRTHQVRVQFASRRMPLLGDGKYGSREKACRTALWSYRLTLPDGRQTVCPPPDVYPWDLFPKTPLPPFDAGI